MQNDQISLVKIGGSTFAAGDTTLIDVSKLVLSGEKLVVVHGGGAAVNHWLNQLGVETQFLNGLRVTDQATLEVVTGVLAGIVNKSLVVQLRASGVNAVGLSGVDGGLLTGFPLGPQFGNVAGEVESNPTIIFDLLKAGITPVVAPLALNSIKANSYLNVNADTAAGEIARAIEAVKLVFMTDVDGILDNKGEVIKTLSRNSIEDLIQEGVLSGGMIPKVRACALAAEMGIVAAIINGTKNDALVSWFSGIDIGTSVV